MVSEILPLTVIRQYVFTNEILPVVYLLMTVVKGIRMQSYTVNVCLKYVVVILYTYGSFYIPYVVPYMAPQKL